MADFGWLYCDLDSAMLAAFGHPKPPAPPPPAPIPDLQDPALLATRKRDLEGAMSRSGRLSTMLTDENGYNRERLGVK